MKPNYRSQAPELLRDMTDKIKLALSELCRLDDDKAGEIATLIVDRMAADWGGQNIYFPMGLVYKLSKRDRQIYDDFNGANHADLARRYSVTVTHIYRIIRAVREEEFRRRQGGLFDE